MPLSQFIFAGILAIAVPTAMGHAAPAQSSTKGKRKAAKPNPELEAKTTLDELRLVEGDEEGNEVKSLKAEILVRKTEAQAIAQALALLQKHHGTVLEPEILFRLAELYMRRSKGDRFFEIHRESETVVKLAPRLVAEASSRESVTKAIAAYADIQARYPDFAQIDLVIFNQAFANQSLGQEKTAEVLYQKLINDHSTSILVPDSQLAIGEINFTKGAFAVALDHFNAIRKFPESRVYPYGLYKAAWTHYNLRDAEHGLKKLEEVVAFGRFVSQAHVDARLDLRKEALNDMTLFYEDVYPAGDTYKYFLSQAGPAEVGGVLLRMAQLYERHSRFADQRLALQQFSDHLPESPLMVQVNVDLIMAHDHLRDKDRAIQQLGSLSSLCQKKISADCPAALSDSALKLARRWLRAYKKLPSDTSFADAGEKAFAIYLKNTAPSPERLEANYSYADLLYSRGQYREASVQYAEVSRVPGDNKTTRDAGYFAIVSLEKAVGDKWSGEDEKTFRALAGEYVAHNPRGPYRLDLEYKMALLDYEKSRYQEAAPVFLRLGKEFPTQDKGLRSQDLYLDILNLNKDYKGVREYAAGLLAANQSVTPERGQKLKHLHEQAFFLQIQLLEEQNKTAEALAGYLDFARQNPTSDLGEKATWNAMQLQYKAGDVLGGSRTAEQFAERYPTSPQATNALLRAAQNYEQMAQLKAAARVLKVLSQRDVKSSARWKGLAAEFLALGGDVGGAKQLYADLAAAPLDVKTRRELLVKQDAFEKNYGGADSRRPALHALVDQGVEPQTSEYKTAAVEAQLASGNPTDAFNSARHLLGNSALAAEYKARLRLVQAKVLEDEFLKAGVKSRAERVATVLAIKTEKLTKAQEALTSAIKFGDPTVSLEGFRRLYGCYRAYVKSLKEMPAPTGLSLADAQAFRAEIDRLLVPLEEKSVDTLAQAVKFAKSQNLLDGSTTQLEAELNQLNGQANPDLAPKLSLPEPALPLLAGMN